MELRINNISRTYSNGVEAINTIAIAYGLLVPNGTGKSTLMRNLATLKKPDEGSIYLGNIDRCTELEGGAPDAILPAPGVWCQPRGGCRGAVQSIRRE